LENKIHPTVKNISGMSTGTFQPLSRKGNEAGLAMSITPVGTHHHANIMDLNQYNGGAKTKLEGPSTGQLQTKLELIE
jgi:hypothetical protein